MARVSRRFTPNLAEGVGFAQILLELTVSFAPLNRVIKHYQRVFGT